MQTFHWAFETAKGRGERRGERAQSGPSAGTWRWDRMMPITKLPLHSSSLNEASHHFKGHKLQEKLLSDATTDLHFACMEGLFSRGGKGRGGLMGFGGRGGGIRRDLIGFILECRDGRGWGRGISPFQGMGTIWRFHGQASGHLVGGRLQDHRCSR